MPKHIKICKHPETRKFYVSDVCEFLSVEVCCIVSTSCNRMYVDSDCCVYMYYRNWWPTTSKTLSALAFLEWIRRSAILTVTWWKVLIDALDQPQFLQLLISLRPLTHLSLNVGQKFCSTSQQNIQMN